MNPLQLSKWCTATIICLSQLSVGLSISAVNIAMPSMMASLGASFDEIHWVLTAFLITRTVFMPTVGWLGSRIGNRNLFVLCTAIFAAGAFLCSLSWDANSLIVFRIIQAVGAGPLTAISMMIIFEAFPSHQRGLALGLFSGSWSIGPFIGAALGGYIAQQIEWRAIFYINVILGITAVVGGYTVFPKKNQQDKAVPFDVLGFLTFTSGTIALLLALTLGRKLGWGSPFIVTVFVLAFAMLTCFVFLEFSVNDPFLELHCFRSLDFTLSNILNFCRVFGFRGMEFLVSFFLQKCLNYTPLQAGMFLLPGAALTAVSSPLAGAISDRIGPVVIVVAGFCLLTIASYGLSLISIWSGISLVLVFIGLQSVGQSCLNAPLNSVALQALPEAKARMGSGIITMIRGLAECFGVAIMSVLLERQVFFNLSLTTPSSAPYLSAPLRYETTSQLQGLLIQAGETGLALGAHLQSLLSYTLFTEALIRSFHNLFLMIGGLYLLMSLATAVFLRPAKKKIHR